MSRTITKHQLYICSEQYDRIPSWQFWCKDEKEFWFGGILACYARITGSVELNDRAEEIFDRHYSKSEKWVKKLAPNPTRSVE